MTQIQSSLPDSSPAPLPKAEAWLSLLTRAPEGSSIVKNAFTELKKCYADVESVSLRCDILLNMWWRFSEDLEESTWIIDELYKLTYDKECSLYYVLDIFRRIDTFHHNTSAHHKILNEIKSRMKDVLTTTPEAVMSETLAQIEIQGTIAFLVRMAVEYNEDISDEHLYTSLLSHPQISASDKLTVACYLEHFISGGVYDSFVEQTGVGINKTQSWIDLAGDDLGEDDPGETVPWTNLIK